MSRVDAPGRRRSVLVVDDDPALLGLFSTLLTRDGFSVDSAANGRVAYEHLKRGSYSVIILDLMMPEVNGLELLERLERESPLMMRRVIVLTGAAQRIVDGLDASRVWAVIRKPFELEDLVKSAKDCVRGRRNTGLRPQASGLGSTAP